MITRRTLMFSVAALASGPKTFGAALAQSYPSKPIKLIVPLPPGGTIDVVGRVVAQHLSSRLGQSVIVENRIGAGGTIGIKAVATADPDGYTLLFGTSGSLAISPALYRSSTEIGNLVPVAATAINPPLLLAVAAEVPAQTVGDVIALAKANPGKLAHGSTLGSPPHLVVEFFRAKAGIDIQHVPYRGSAQAIPDLLGGQIQIIAESIPILMPFVQQGKLRSFLVASKTRRPELPTVPTLTEIGLDGFPPETWTGVLAPNDTPREIVDKLNVAVNAALQTPEMTASLAKLGFYPEPASAKDFADMVAVDTKKWAEVVRLTGIKID
jgi:tripartite-type tricarboxylate transporter receptor subunit TctC